MRMSLAVRRSLTALASGAMLFVAAGGAAAAPIFSAAPTVLSFGSVTVGALGAVQMITVRNTGDAAVTGIAVTQGNAARFPVYVDTCGAILNAGAACALTVGYSPNAVNTDGGSIVILSANGGTIAISLSGTGVAPPPPATLSASPPLASFGSVIVGQTSAAITITVTNAGGSAATGLSFGNSNSVEFPVSGNTCGATLNAGATCVLSVAYAPNATGTDAAALTWTYGGGALSVSLSGTGVTVLPPPQGAGQLSMPASMSFASQVLGLHSAPQAVTVSNIGTGTVTVKSITSSNASEFAVSGSTCASVSAGASCTFNVTFSPFNIGARSATISVATNGLGGPQSIQASGTGLSGATPPPPPPPANVTSAIEYYHAAFDHYFVTAIADEIAKLDNGTFAGWTRTGKRFNVYAAAAAGLKTTCRFFSTAFGPKSAHFYTPDAPECTTVKASQNWQYEGDVFFTVSPAQDGSCPAGMSPVYRLYNNGQGGAPNHRYTTEVPVRATMLAQGWIAEGYGAIGVIMCAPP